MNKKEILQLSNSALDKTVRLEGTKYDRRRKVTPELRTKMSKMYDSGKSYQEIGIKYDVQPNTVRYNLDKAFKVSENARRRQYTVNANANSSDAVAERIAYKRSLIEANKRLPVND